MENSPVRIAPKLTLVGARLALDAAEKKAEDIGQAMDIAVVDDGGNLVAFSRMDGARITSIDIAMNKAFTAAGARRPTADYAEIAGPGKPAFGIHASNQGRFTIFGGGLPIVWEGEVIGAVGCSSGSVEQDTQVAQAGVDAVLDALRSQKTS
jgi:uncharacterized protein GlcG (DUF336 family)